MDTIPTPTWTSRMQSALPGGFEFFHLGTVTPSPKKPAEPIRAISRLEDSCAIAFRLNGDVDGVAIALFDQGLDPSVYTEMANILVSRLADRLGDVMISPPLPLTAARARAIEGSASETIHREYLHFHEGRTVTIHLALFHNGTEGTAHA